MTHVSEAIPVIGWETELGLSGDPWREEFPLAHPEQHRPSQILQAQDQAGTAILRRLVLVETVPGGIHG